jgi:glucose/arabinose dehydrogenase
LADLPGGGQHVTRNILIKDNKIYVAIGSSENVSIESNPVRTTIQQFNLDGSGQVPFATGLRNPVGLDVNPVTNELWTTVIERDGLGDELVPDYLTSVQQGGFYGYPYAYLSPDNLDPRIDVISPLTATTITPSVLFKAHETSIGVLFYKGTSFPEEYRNDAYVAFRGSWNRTNGAGYKVARVRMNAQGVPEGGYENFVTGWHINPGQGGVPRVFGRPISIVEGPDGSMLISDDAGGTIWRLRYIN